MPREDPWVRQQWTLRLPRRDGYIPGRKVDQGSRNLGWTAYWIENGVITRKLQTQDLGCKPQGRVSEEEIPGHEGGMFGS